MKHYGCEDDLFRRARERGIPINADMELTYRCNLDCVHCFNCPTDNKELSFKEVVSVIDQLARGGVIFLTLGGGEPLIRRDFFDIAFYARRRGFALSLYTNATLVTKESAKKIALLHPRCVSATMYGASEKGYAKTTGDPGAFHKAVRGIRLLSEEKLPLDVCAMAFRSTSIKDLLWMKEFSKGLGAWWSLYTLFLLRTNGDPTPLKYGVTKSQCEALLEKFPEIRLRPKRRRRDASSRVCGSLRTNVYVSPYGNVGSCSMLTSKESIRERSLMSIWKNSYVLRTQREFKLAKLHKCLHCESLPYCQPCIANNYVCTGKFGEPVEVACENKHMLRECSEKFLSAGT